MPGGVKLHRVFFCRLRNREAWLEGSDLLILKRDSSPPDHGFEEVYTPYVLCTCGALRPRNMS